MAASGHARPSRGSFSDLSRRRKAVCASAARSNHNPGHAPGFLFLTQQIFASPKRARPRRRMSVTTPDNTKWIHPFG